MVGFNIFGTVDKVVINGTEWKPQHMQEALAAIERYRRFLTALYFARIDGKVTVYARIRRHTAGSLYAVTRYHRLHRRAESCWQ